MSDHDQSLWSETCREHVESQPLTRDITVDLAVIGGGYTGCSAALTAAQAGASVCVFEAQGIGHGGSGRNVGFANAGLWLPPEEIRKYLGTEAGNRLIDLLGAAPSEVFDLIEAHGIDCDPVRDGEAFRDGAGAGWPSGCHDVESLRSSVGFLRSGTLSVPKAGGWSSLPPLEHPSETLHLGHLQGDPEHRQSDNGGTRLVQSLEYRAQHPCKPESQ